MPSAATMADACQSLVCTLTDKMQLNTSDSGGRAQPEGRAMLKLIGRGRSVSHHKNEGGGR